MTTKTDNAVQQSQTFPFWPLRWKIILPILGLLLLLWLGLKAWRIGQAANSLLAQQKTAETLMANGLTNIDPDTAESMVKTIRQDFVVLRDETAFLMPLLPHLNWVPKAGPLLVSAPYLVEMGDAGTETAVYAITSLKPILHIMQAEDASDSQLPQLVNALAEARPGLAQAALSLDRVAQARPKITNVDEFPEQIKPLFAQVDEWLPIAQDSLAIVQILPEIMGHNGRRTYLLLAQNEDEIRATGGFISGVGTLTIENGDIQSLTFQDASTFDMRTFLENSENYDRPPQPLYDLMGSQYFLLRDANYWPDFPYSAQQAVALYQRVEPTIILDGVIAIDQQFMSLLVAATGPITIPDSGQTITASNTVDSFRSAFNIEEGQAVNEWIQNRKAFLTTFSTAILEKIQGDFGVVDPVAFIKNIHFALASRHLQLYMVDDQETAVLDHLNWDGRLENPAAQDFLLVLDTNVGFNKANMHMVRHIDYAVALNPDGTAKATLTANYTHQNPPNENLGCEQAISYADAPTYQEIANRCYFNYLRIYAPPGTVLLDTTNHTIPAEVLISETAWDKSAEPVSEFANFTTFANFMMVPHGETVTTSFHYQLPSNIVRQQDHGAVYQLWLRKQAGTQEQSVTVTLTLPINRSATQVTASSTSTIVTQGSTVTFNLDLQTDTLLTVVFEE